MKLKRTLVAPTLVALVATVSGGWLLQQGAGPGQEDLERARLFEEVMEHVSSRYVEEVSRAELYDKAIEGLLRELGDPHTALMTPEEYANLRVQTEGEYGGLGIEIAVRDGWVTVISPLPDTPAERAGLQAGDRIVEIEGESTEGWSEQDAVNVLRGPKGAPVEIKIARPGVDDPIPVRIVRDEIRYAAVEASHMIEDGIGYVQLRVFSETATREVRAAISDLQEQGMRRLILDLRGNPGGLLEQGVSVSDLFLPRGDAIVETRAREARQNHTFRATRQDQYADVPVVVLVDRSSASASEIVAGALQDHDRAVVLGSPSFGKGSVQTLYPLSSGYFLKMTSGLWYTPVGRSIEKLGDDDRRGDPVALLEGEEDPDADEPGRVPVPAGEVVDTTQRQPYRTDSGRIVYGGGGIVPDLMVSDALTEPEQEFLRAIYRAGTMPEEIFFPFAVEHLQRNPDLPRDFEVTPQMRRQVLERVRAAGVEVSDEEFEAARRLVDSRIAFQLTLQKFGRPAARERANAADAVVAAAVDILRGATDPGSVFRLVQQRHETARSH